MHAVTSKAVQLNRPLEIRHGWMITHHLFIIIFPSKCVWKACFPVLLTHGGIPASGSKPPPPPPPPPTHTHTHTHTTGFPPQEKTKTNQHQHRTGGNQLSTWTKRGGIWTDAWVCLHYWVVIWAANFHLYCAVYGVCHRTNTYGLKVVFCFRHFSVFHYHHCAWLLTGTEYI